MCIMEIRVCEFYDEQVGGLKFTLLGQGTKQNKTLSNFTKGFHTLLKLIYLDGLIRLKPLYFFLFKHMEWIYGTTYDTNQLIYMGVHF